MAWTWTGGGSTDNWTDAANWSPNGVPNSDGQTVTIIAGDTIVVPDGLRISSLFINGTGTATLSGSGTFAAYTGVTLADGQTLNISNLSLTATDLSFGAGPGTFGITGGSFTTSDGFAVAAGQTLDLTNTSYATTSALTGSGAVVLNGATVSLSGSAPAATLSLVFDPVAQNAPQNVLSLPSYTTGVRLGNLGYGDIIKAGGATLSLVRNGTSDTYSLNGTLNGSTHTISSDVTLVSGADASDFGDDANGNLVWNGPPLCYLRGTLILTPTGAVPIEDIAVGDLVVTRFGGFLPVEWIGRQTRRPRAGDISGIAPVRIRAEALGEGIPARELAISPGHSMLVGESLLMARYLVNGVSITQEMAAERNPDPIDYFQIELAGHDCIAAEGAWSESFADGPGLRAAFDNARGYQALHPGYRPPEDVDFCAPRPEKGARLEAALRPIVARASAGLTPGTLRGAVDRVSAPWTVEGWAWDEAHPRLPVLLEVLLDGEAIGSILACAYRRDLAEAGFGDGRCAFFWTAPVELVAADAGRLHIRRVSDGAVLPGCASPVAAKSAAPQLRLVG